MNELQIIWYLIVTVFTHDGLTQFDLEYETKTECKIAMLITQDIERRKSQPRIWVLECREWPLDAPDVERSVKT